MKSALLRADPSNAQLYPPESSASYMNLPRIASEDLFNVKINNYEKSQILFSLRGILFLNSEGYRVNQ